MMSMSIKGGNLRMTEAFPCSVCASTEVLNVCEAETPLIVQNTSNRECGGVGKNTGSVAPL